MANTDPIKSSPLSINAWDARAEHELSETNTTAYSSTIPSMKELPKSEKTESRKKDVLAFFRRENRLPENFSELRERFFSKWSQFDFKKNFISPLELIALSDKEGKVTASSLKLAFLKGIYHVGVRYPLAVLNSLAKATCIAITNRTFKELTSDKVEKLKLAESVAKCNAEDDATFENLKKEGCAFTKVGDAKKYLSQSGKSFALVRLEPYPSKSNNEPNLQSHYGVLYLDPAGKINGPMRLNHLLDINNQKMGAGVDSFLKDREKYQEKWDQSQFEIYYNDQKAHLKLASKNLVFSNAESANRALSNKPPGSYVVVESSERNYQVYFVAKDKSIQGPVPLHFAVENEGYLAMFVKDPTSFINRAMEVVEEMKHSAKDMYTASTKSYQIDLAHPLGRHEVGEEFELEGEPSPTVSHETSISKPIDIEFRNLRFVSSDQEALAKLAGKPRSSYLLVAKNGGGNLFFVNKDKKVIGPIALTKEGLRIMADDPDKFMRNLLVKYEQLHRRELAALEQIKKHHRYAEQYDDTAIIKFLGDPQGSYLITPVPEKDRRWDLSDYEIRYRAKEGDSEMITRPVRLEHAFDPLDPNGGQSALEMLLSSRR